MVRLLLERQVDVNTPGKHRLTPLHVAAHYKHPNVAALLLDNHADPHRVAKVNCSLQNAKTVLFLYASCCLLDVPATIVIHFSTFD